MIKHCKEYNSRRIFRLRNKKIIIIVTKTLDRDWKNIYDCKASFSLKICLPKNIKKIYMFYAHFYFRYLKTKKRIKKFILVFYVLYQMQVRNYLLEKWRKILLFIINMFPEIAKHILFKKYCFQEKVKKDLYLSWTFLLPLLRKKNWYKFVF